MKRKIIEIIEKICSKQVLTSFLVFLVIGSAIFFYTFHKYRYAPDFRRDVLVETHGMALDILVIGTFIFALQKIGKKKLERERNIQRWQEEIDDFRGWDEKEATYRIVGNIRRLNRYGITDINLSSCYLKHANLADAQLQGANLLLTNLQGAFLQHANFDKAEMKFANLQGSNLIGASFISAKLNPANLEESELCDTNFQKANLAGANLQKAKLFWTEDTKESKIYRANLQETILDNAKLTKANLAGAILANASFIETNLQEAELRETIGLTVEQLSKVKTLYNAKLDPDLEKEIKEKYPHLLEKPKEEE